MKNFTLLLLCIGFFIVVTYANEEEQESIQELDSESVEDLLSWRCKKEGQECNKRRCCRRLKCDNKTKKCVKEPCKTENQACRRNNECCKDLKCCRKQRKCLKKKELIPEDLIPNIDIHEDFDEEEED